MTQRYIINPMPAQIAADKAVKYATVETATVGHQRLMGFMEAEIQCVLADKWVAGTAVTLDGTSLDMKT